jgi:hypothetical protein
MRGLYKQSPYDAVKRDTSILEELSRQLMMLRHGLCSSAGLLSYWGTIRCARNMLVTISA